MRINCRMSLLTTSGQPYNNVGARTPFVHDKRGVPSVMGEVMQIAMSIVQCAAEVSSSLHVAVHARTQPTQFRGIPKLFLRR